MTKVKLDDILDECLERIAAGSTIEECAAAFPEHAEALTPLLETALALGHISGSVRLSPEAKARGLDRLMDAIDRRQASKRWWHPFIPSISRPVGAALAGVAVVLVTAGWTTAAASDTLPGDPLYWVKSAKERVMLEVPRSDVGQAQAHADLARVRVQEMRQLVASGRVNEAEQLLAKLDHHLNELAGYVGVTVASDPIEMPVVRVRLASAGDVASIARRLERDERWLKSRLNALVNSMDSDMGQQADRVRRLSYLRYRTVIVSLDATQNSGTRLFWRNESVRLSRR